VNAEPPAKASLAFVISASQFELQATENPAGLISAKARGFNKVVVKVLINMLIASK
jgi:hypothetical protein